MIHTIMYSYTQTVIRGNAATAIKMCEHTCKQQQPLKALEQSKIDMIMYSYTQNVIRGNATTPILRPFSRMQNLSRSIVLTHRHTTIPYYQYILAVHTILAAYILHSCVFTTSNHFCALVLEQDCSLRLHSLWWTTRSCNKRRAAKLLSRTYSQTPIRN